MNIDRTAEDIKELYYKNKHIHSMKDYYFNMLYDYCKSLEKYNKKIESLSNPFENGLI